MSGNMMDDEALFMEWAMDMLEHELPAVAVVNDVHSGEETCFPSLEALRDISQAPLFLPEMELANRGSSGESDGTGHFSSRATIEHDVWPPSPNSGRCAPTSNGGTTNQPVMGWNFSGAVPTQPGVEGTIAAVAAGPYEPGVPQPVRRFSARSATTTGPASSTPYAHDHIMAERKRREKINKRFIELSTVIPCLKKMDKATILSDATRHVMELQEKIKVLETASRSTDSMVLVKKPYHAVPGENGSPSSPGVVPAARNNPLPEIEVRFSENGAVMLRIICDDTKGLVVRVLSEVEEGLHLGITHANVMPFTASTIIITITAKVEDGCTVRAEDIVGRLTSTAKRTAT